jgi:fucokinase
MPNLSALRRHNQARYLRQVRGEEPPGWDYVLLTASHERQAEGYRRELERRLRAGWLPAASEYLVVPDFGGRRLGSGGAAAYALRELFSRFPQAAAQWGRGGPAPRVLLLNSGGDSKRLPHAAAVGKAFLSLSFPLFPGGPRSTVFDETFLSCCGLPATLPGGGVVIIPGDDLRLFDPAQFTPGPGVTGLAHLCPWELASQHGIYVCPPEGGPVAHFLQKPSKAYAESLGALLGDLALLDTGMLAFDPDATLRLASLAGVRLEGEQLHLEPGALEQPGAETAQIDLYSDLCLALAGQPPPQDSPDDPGRRQVRAQVYATMTGVAFSACVPRPCSFVHLGTTREWRDFCTGQTPESPPYRSGPAGPAHATLIPRLQITPPALVEYSRAPSAEVGEGAVLTQVQSDEPLTLPPGLLLFQAPLLPSDGGAAWVARGVVCRETGPIRPPAAANEPLSGGAVMSEANPARSPQPPTGRIHDADAIHPAPPWIACVYGVDDNPKLANQSLLSALQAQGVTAETLWPGLPPADRCLWNARLYVPGSRPETTSWALWLATGPSPERLAAWQAAPRLSLEQVAQQADLPAASQDRARLWGECLGREMVEKLSGEDCIHPLLDQLSDPEEASAVIRCVLNALETEKNLHRRSRLWYALTDLHRRRPAVVPVSSDPDSADQFEHQAFAEIAAVVAQGLPTPLPTTHHRPPTTDLPSARVFAPVRLDLAGGWSDTPPFSLEHGGAVLNAAINLDGAHPIQARAHLLPDPILEVISVDAQTRETLTTVAALTNYVGPGHPLAIHKAALVLSGIGQNGEDIATSLASWGGGLRLETQINLPLGSGLGASSIAALALLRALDLLRGLDSTPADLSARVLYLEQLLTTGGGWQDQLGALYPGFKLLETTPGPAQTPRVTPVRLSPATLTEIHQRLLLAYVGERRVAKNILRQVVRRWLAREPEVVASLHAIKHLAREMRGALESGDLDAFGRLVSCQWQHNQRLDPLSTTPHVEALLDALGDLASGARLGGAGGGGFLEIIARDESAATLIRRRLTPLLDTRHGRFYEARIDEQGLLGERTGPL